MTRPIDYGTLMHRAMRGLIHDVLDQVAREGLPGEHHFFITFDTRQPGVELADWLQDSMEDGVRYVFGPGSTLHGLAQNLGLETTLLGVDVIENGQVLAHDVTEAQLFELVEGHPSRLLVTAIGGQGHILGRGNQQISPRVVRAIGLDHLRVVATKRKLGTLQGRPLLVDSGDPQLDDSFPAAVRVWAGYKEELLYPLGWQREDAQ